ncbi:hypothetical protein SAMN04488511_103338 [Pedobacter suwonensis]|uniref:Uncharacterized protein n=1 Tax=Pedobacter suwonensis TaxID=332999 RepID=A0A1I0SV75_9SPHI|nr:hypothetical protein [Pedobacter suwonensis]SFA43399.1 hypothetical protein SAMN04488511_103338 [Pedobacter suwonensis]
MDFSKADNKVARKLFEVALQRELKKEMQLFSEILDQWKAQQPEDNRDDYYKIFTAVKDFDKHIARRYDGLRNSWFLGTITALLVEKIITADDLEDFSEEAKSEISRSLKFREVNQL